MVPTFPPRSPPLLIDHPIDKQQFPRNTLAHSSNLSSIPRKRPNMAEKEFTYSDVSEHSSKDDIYMVVHDKVYDCSKFVDEHP